MIETRLQTAERNVREAQEAAQLAADRLAKLQTEQASMTDEQIMAVDMHNALCSNNASGCAWGLEERNGSVDWDGWEHAEYLKRATILRTEFPDLKIENTLRIYMILVGQDWA